jgi:hypothetical protein
MLMMRFMVAPPARFDGSSPVLFGHYLEEDATGSGQREIIEGNRENMAETRARCFRLRSLSLAVHAQSYLKRRPLTPFEQRGCCHLVRTPLLLSEL